MQRPTSRESRTEVPPYRRAPGDLRSVATRRVKQGLPHSRPSDGAVQVDTEHLQRSLQPWSCVWLGSPAPTVQTG